MNEENLMTMTEAEEWVAGLPWRRVREHRGPIESHEYVISSWDEVDINLYWAVVRLIRREGYQAATGRRTGRTSSCGTTTWRSAPRFTGRFRPSRSVAR